MVKDLDYKGFVENTESDLREGAKKSFEDFSPDLVDGRKAFDFYSNLSRTQEGRVKLFNRTPLQLERDRILYSPLLRKQTEKYHVLYSGQKRITRNYTTHTMRMAHVARSVAKALNLNHDFAEAIALGCKAGASPFIHAAKDSIDQWIKMKIRDIDNEERMRCHPEKGPELNFDGSLMELTKIRIKKYMPWLTDLSNNCKAYTSGQESYWLLCTDPFLRKISEKGYFPETVYGIWQHSKETKPMPDSFSFEWQTPEGSHNLNWKYGTYEGMIVQYADDITWAIENLNDANNVALLNRNSRGLYHDLSIELSKSNCTNHEVSQALLNNNSGALYGFFISDLVSSSESILERLKKDDIQGRSALREGAEHSFIRLSESGELILNKMINFLKKEVFQEPRVSNRKEMLSSIIRSSLDLLYTSEDTIKKYIDDRALQEAWQGDTIIKAKEKISDDINRVQLAVDIFSSMSDQEIFDFVGMHSL